MSGGLDLFNSDPSKRIRIDESLLESALDYGSPWDEPPSYTTAPDNSKIQQVFEKLVSEKPLNLARPDLETVTGDLSLAPSEPPTQKKIFQNLMFSCDWDNLLEMLKTYKPHLDAFEEVFLTLELVDQDRFDILFYLIAHGCISDMESVIKKIQQIPCPEKAHYILKNFPIAHPEIIFALKVAALEAKDHVVPNKKITKILTQEISQIHQVLVDLAIKLGYPVQSKGICLGLTASANLSIMTGKKDQLLQRIYKLAGLYNAEISKGENYQDALEHIASQVSTDLEMKAWMDSVFFLFHALNFLDSTALPLKQFKEFSHNEMYNLVKPVELDKLGNIYCVPCSKNLYNYWEFKQHIQDLQNYFDLHQAEYVDEKRPWVAIDFFINTHVVSACYNPFDKTFIFNDSNHFNLIELKSSEELAEVVFRGLTDQSRENDFDPYAFIPVFTQFLTFKEAKPEKYPIVESQRASSREILDLSYVDFEKSASLLVLKVDAITPDLDKFIGLGPLINFFLKDGSNPLFQAIGLCKLDVVKALVRAGADINKANTKGTTPLTVAILLESVEVVKFLLESKVQVDTVDSYRMTPVGLARSIGQDAIAEILIQAGARPEWFLNQNLDEIVDDF